MVVVEVVLAALPRVESHGYYSVRQRTICLVVAYVEPLTATIPGQGRVICEYESRTFSHPIMWEDVERELRPEDVRSVCFLFHCLLFPLRIPPFPTGGLSLRCSTGFSGNKCLDGGGNGV